MLNKSAQEIYLKHEYLNNAGRIKGERGGTHAPDCRKHLSLHCAHCYQAVQWQMLTYWAFQKRTHALGNIRRLLNATPPRFMWRVQMEAAF